MWTLKRSAIIWSFVVTGAVALGGCSSTQERDRDPGTTVTTGTTGTQETTGTSGTTGEEMGPTAEVMEENVNRALGSSPDLTANDIDVEVRDPGIVVLTGRVPADRERQLAHDIAHTVRGVRSVEIAELKVQPKEVEGAGTDEPST
jgi:osmotically-inducible protein OsmY